MINSSRFVKASMTMYRPVRLKKQMKNVDQFQLNVLSTELKD